MYISGEETSYYALIFPLESLAFSPEDYVQQKYLDPLFRRELLFPEHWPPGTPEQKAMQTEFLRIRELHENRPSGYELAVRTALLQLVSAMVSLGKMMPGTMTDIMEARDRRAAGHTAPPYGLYLAEVYY